MHMQLTGLYSVPCNYWRYTYPSVNIESEQCELRLPKLNFIVLQFVIVLKIESVFFLSVSVTCKLGGDTHRVVISVDTVLACGTYVVLVMVLGERGVG